MAELPTVIEQRRLRAPTVTPQALAWHGGRLWMGSRDLRRVYMIEPDPWTVAEEMEAPGIPWAACSMEGSLRFTLGVGPEDDRYVYHYSSGGGFSDSDRIACPDFTGSYLSYDGEHLHLSQWYKGRILKLDGNGSFHQAFEVGGEISGHTFADGMVYVLRGTEQDGEKWSIARLDPNEANPQAEEVARVPFACRSLAFDGEKFWSNHRAANETIAFTLPE